MMILGVDTSTTSGSAALLEDGYIVGEINLDVEKTHSERLLPSIHQLLESAGISTKDIDGFAVTIGPGSFTGLKVGLSTVKGLAWAYNKPVVGVSTLSALAHNISFATIHICPIIDAKKNEVYTALFRNDGRGTQRRVCDDMVVMPEKLVDLISEETVFLGNGVRLYSSYLRERLGSRVLFAPPVFWLVRASVVASITVDGFIKGEVQSPESILPEYIRASEAELKGLKKV